MTSPYIVIQSKSYTYDPADRVVTTTLPNSEVITQTYKERSLAKTLVSSTLGTLVSASTYNILDQRTQMDLGNGVITTRRVSTGASSTPARLPKSSSGSFTGPGPTRPARPT